MERLNKTTEQDREMDGSESLGEKRERFEISVKETFDKNMEAKSVVRRIIEENKSSFLGPEERSD